MKPLALTVCLVLAGCTSTHPFDPATPDGRALANRALADQSAVLLLADGQRVRTRALRFDAEGASWVDAETGAARAARYDEVRLAHVPRVRRRALNGLVLGTAAGLVLGTLAGRQVPESASPAIFATSVVGGALVGTAGGWAAGSVGDVYAPRATGAPSGSPASAPSTSRRSRRP